MIAQLTSGERDGPAPGTWRLKLHTAEIAADFDVLTDTDLDLLQGAVRCSPCNDTGFWGGGGIVGDTPGFYETIRGTYWTAVG